MPEAEIAERFQRETASHTMDVKHDDGLYRHLRFRDPKHGCYWFDLITVPGALIFQGDGETFAFRRIEDMFEFFRNPSGRINPGYWAEKLTSDRDSVMTYDEDLLKRWVADELKEAEEDYPGVTEAWDALTGGVLPEYYTGTEEEARAALDSFEFGGCFKASCRKCEASEEFDTKAAAERWCSDHFTSDRHIALSERVKEFRFTDTWEWRLKDYDWWFLWALHGIVWGIAQYDASKAAARSADAEAVAS